MSLSFGQRILRLLDPQGERERMEMRQARCMAEANADDLMRTMSLNRDKIVEMMAARKKSVSQGKKDFQ